MVYQNWLIQNFGGALAIVISLGSLVLTVFWMVVGWRTMRAHERLARAAEEVANARKP